jgi:hypothetical protein
MTRSFIDSRAGSSSPGSSPSSPHSAISSPQHSVDTRCCCRPVDGKALLLNPLPAQLEFIACESLLDGLKPISSYVASSNSSERASPRHPLVLPAPSPSQSIVHSSPACWMDYRIVQCRALQTAGGEWGLRLPTDPMNSCTKAREDH